MMANDFTIITDLGGVLVAVDKRRMCAEFARHSTLSAKEILSNFSSTKLTKFDLGFGKGLLTPRDFYRATAVKLRLSDISFGKFARLYSDIFRRKEDTISLLRKLGKTHTIALLSNTDRLHYGRWSKLLGADLKLFKELVLSFRVHAAKPNKEIFLAAVKALKVKPEQCIYIDDIKDYAKAASRLGMKGIHFTSAMQLQRDLNKLGIMA